MFALPNKKIWIAGHRGMVGQALMRQLQDRRCTLLTASRSELDLRRQDAVERWLEVHRPDAIIIAAATVGGIEANRTRPAEFLYDNLMMAANIIHAAGRQRTGKLLFLGSSCIYPREAAQPITEDSLLTGALEPTNQWYAIAKIAAIKLCQAYRRQYGCDFITAMPCNLYGPGDHYDAVQSHVIPALIMKMDRAARQNEKSVTLWGSGAPLREFLHVDDLARALVLLLEHYSGEAPMNVGSGAEISIRSLAQEVAKACRYQGEICFDPSMPDGVMRKLLDSRHIRALGWQPEIDLCAGLADAAADYNRIQHADAA